jgi:hypothetical protein
VSAGDDSAVDVEGRGRAVALLENFLAARISNDELEDSWPTDSLDPALEEIRRAVWLTYDDLHEHLGPTADHGLIDRCAAFLRTREPYRWPIPKLWQRIVGACVSIMTLGRVELALAGPRVDEPWPYLPPVDVTG